MIRVGHLYHFLILILILGGGAVTFFFLSGNQYIQFLVGVITAIGYISWGMLHHGLQGDLHRKVVVEYLLIGSIAILLLLLVLRI